MLRYEIASINDLDENIYDKCLSLMEPSRKSALLKIKSIEKRKQSVLGEWLAKKLISEERHCLPDDIVFLRDKKSKPYSPTNPDIHFNISHSEDKVIAVISDIPIGIDIEKIRPVSLKIAKRICTDNELLYVFGKFPGEADFFSTEELCFRRFFEIWTAKEAYFKCVGTGITNPKSIDTIVDLPEKITISEDGYIIHIVEKEV